MATLGGVEPPTSCFVGKRSIQLSYRVVAFFDYSIIFRETHSLRKYACAQTRRKGTPKSPSVDYAVRKGWSSAISSSGTCSGRKWPAGSALPLA